MLNELESRSRCELLWLTLGRPVRWTMSEIFVRDGVPIGFYINLSKDTRQGIAETIQVSI